MDRNRNGPFWEPHASNRETDRAGFEIVNQMEELEHVSSEFDRPGDSAVWNYQLHRFMATKNSLQVFAQKPNGDDARLYRQTAPHEARVFELLPGKPHDVLTGRLHYVDVEFTHDALPGSFFGDLDRTEVYQQGGTPHGMHFAISLPLGKKVPYTAVSYVWGHGTCDCVIRVSGHDLLVTQTVDTILRRLRDIKRSGFLWIDQICIDQSSVDDKKSQVQLMGTIYSRARNTVIWLGEEPDRGALRALRGIADATVGRDDDLLDDELEYLRHPLNENEGTFESLAELLQRPWFQRTWVVQEAVLSKYLFLMIGPDMTAWEDFAGHCVSIRNLDIFQEAAMDDPEALRKSGLSVVAEMWQDKYAHNNLNAIQSLFDWLIRTRAAAVADPLDKVYGVLGLCSNSITPDYNRPKHDLFYQVTADAIKDALERISLRQEVDGDLRVVQHRLTRIFDAVDHDPDLSDFPSWVVDWALPRRSISLAHDTAVLSIYEAGGVTDDRAVVQVDNDGRGLRVKAAIFDSIDELSPIFVDADLTSIDPSQHNPSLKEAISFVTKPGVVRSNALFNIFCATLTAGKDRSGMNKAPQEYGEIISFLCDETIGRKPSIPGQTYTPRQSKGYFNLSHLRTRKTGRMFQNFRKAYRNAMLNRRLCWTAKGHLGLVPRCLVASICKNIIVGRGRKRHQLVVMMTLHCQTINTSTLESISQSIEKIVKRCKESHCPRQPSALQSPATLTLHKFTSQMQRHVKGVSFYFTVAAESTQNLVKLDASMSFAAAYSCIEHKARRQFKGGLLGHIDVMFRLPAAGPMEQGMELRVDDDDSWNEVLEWVREKNLTRIQGAISTEE